MTGMKMERLKGEEGESPSTRFGDRIGRFRADDTLPLYLQLQALIRDAIQTGIAPKGSGIPAERDLAIEYAISRITVRKAIEGLVEEGLLIRRRGAGTFVAGRVDKVFSKLSSFTEDMAARGRIASSRWVSRATGPVTPDEAMALGLSPGTPVMRFTRIRLADDEPMALEFSTVVNDCLGTPDDVSDSLYAALERTGNRPVRALQRLRAVPIRQQHARMLEIDTGDPVLMIERRGFLPDGRVVEFTRSYYRGDSYDFVAEL
jgi:GntR family transcriptional regulator